MGDVVDPHYAKTDEYRDQLNEIADEGVCPFCPENFRWHPHDVLMRHDGWLVTPIRESYPNAKWHLLIIGEQHSEHILSLRSGDWSAIGWLVDWAVTRYRIMGGSVQMRFGPTRLSGATVQHLHAHLIEPEIDPDTDRAKVVNFPIG